MQTIANIDVDDLQKGIEFYTRGLNLRIGRRLGGTIVELLGASIPIYLLENAAGSSATAFPTVSRNYQRHWTPVHLDFVVDEIGHAVANARAAGAKLEGEVETHVWGGIARMSDPFGHGFCLLEFRGEGYDEIARNDS
ncbi:MAG: VOC family protein [Gammaproteobacteria bacterium]|nr:VOC family protein [Gammaproteobacteria bacterium]